MKTKVLSAIAAILVAVPAIAAEKEVGPEAEAIVRALVQPSVVRDLTTFVKAYYSGGNVAVAGISLEQGDGTAVLSISADTWCLGKEGEPERCKVGSLVVKQLSAPIRYESSVNDNMAVQGIKVGKEAEAFARALIQPASMQNVAEFTKKYYTSARSVITMIKIDQGDGVATFTVSAMTPCTGANGICKVGVLTIKQLAVPYRYESSVAGFSVGY